LVKIGILIDDYHLKYKVSDFLKYLKSNSEVSIYVDEDFFLDSSDFPFNEDVIFVKAKGEFILNIIKHIEDSSFIPVINNYNSIVISLDRFLHGLVLRKAGVNVPDFSLNPYKTQPPFDDFIIKNIVDKKNYAFKGQAEEKEGHMQVRDLRAIEEAVGGKEKYKYYFYQRFIKSDWEYKIYGIGENIYFYRQIPLLMNPNKMESRHEIEMIPELKEMAYKAMEATGLEITSIDFLKDEGGKFYLTDINSTPNFNYIKHGPRLIGDYLIKRAKK